MMSRCTHKDVRVLSPREREIFDLLRSGQSRKEMAGTLGISPNTVGFHLKRAYLKLNAHSGFQALSRLAA